jgi:RNA polymerase sigma factor (sigma-70 family)
VDPAAEDGDWTPPTWDALVRDHSARVYRLAFRLTGNRHDAEDLTQEVFVRVFRALPTFRPGTLEGWMHRITTNLFLDQARRRRRIRFDALPLDFGDKMPGLMPSPDHELARDLFDPDIENALAQLPPEYRAAVVLCDVEGLTYEEIAQALDVKIGTVRSRIHRGRSLLRKALTHREPSRDRVRYGGPPEASAGDDLDPSAAGSA